MLKNFRKSFKKGVQNSMLFGYKIWQLENWAENDDFLPVKRILLSFPQFLSVWAVILHEVQQCTRKIFHQFDQHPQMRRSELIKIPTNKKDSVRRNLKHKKNHQLRFIDYSA